jgi:hypothetical protein
VKVLPLTANPDQFELMSEDAPRAVPARPEATMVVSVAVRARRFLICCQCCDAA